MDKGGGWIKIYRQIRENWIWEDPEKLKWWLDLLLSANHEDKDIFIKGKVITIKRGQYFTSTGNLAKRWKTSRGTVIRFLRLLNDTAMVTVDGTANGTTLTIVNYSNFQDTRTADGTTDGTTDGTAHGTTGGTQTRRNKNYKETKNARARGVYFENQRKDDLDGDVLKNILGRLNANGEITKAVSGDE